MNPYTNTFANALNVAGVSPSMIPSVIGAAFAIFVVLLIWSIVWKGIALWHSGRNNQKIWFVVFLIVNTAGILEILYILFFRKNKNDIVHTTTVTHSVTASTPAPDMSSSVTSTPSVPPVPPTAG